MARDKAVVNIPKTLTGGQPEPSPVPGYGAGNGNEGRNTHEKAQHLSEMYDCIIKSLPYPTCIIDVKDRTITFAHGVAGIDDLLASAKCYAGLYGRTEPCQGLDRPCPLPRVIETKKPLTVEHVSVDPNGNTRNLWVHCAPVISTSGEVTHIVEHFIDVTDFKQTEEALRESERKFRSLVETTSDWAWEVDQNGIYTYASPRVKDLLGYESEKVIGKTPFDLMPAGEAERVGRLFQGIAESREPFAGLENTNLHKDGRRMVLETSGVPILDEAGNLLGYRGIDRDITERKKAEEALTRTVKQYTAMIDTVPAIMYVKDIDHRYVIVNEAFCKLAGKPADGIIGRTDYDIFSSEKADEYHRADKIIMDEDRRVIDHEQSIKGVDGETKWVSTTRVPVHDSQGLVLGVVGLVQDVTEYHRSREQLVQADKLAAIGTLAAGVAHEINNPIGFISSNLNTMNKYLKKMNSYIERIGTEEDKDRETILEMLTDFADAVDESVEGTTRVKNIVSDLKSFSRVDQAKKKLANINEGIESTLNIVRNELKYHCKVEKDLGDIPDLYCIPNQLNQVFMNILLNAGHATKGRSGLINIRTWADDTNIYASIKDNGVGIPEGNVKKVFEPFFTTKEVGKGTGLGLSLAYDIIKKHNGAIDVKSEVSVGTEFIVSLPRQGLLDD